MPRGAERDSLLWDRGVRTPVVVGVEERPNVDQAGWIGQLAGGGVPLGERHRVALPRGEREPGAQQRFGHRGEEPQPAELSSDHHCLGA